MNKVDYLLKTPFSSLKLEDKLKIKELGAYQPSNFTLTEADGKKMRSFSRHWFAKKPWLTVSEEKQSLFCFYCLLFGGGQWATTGCKNLKHLSERVKKHEESPGHLESACRFKMFGKLNRATLVDSMVKISNQKHNVQVTKNRHILGRILECLLFCATHELALMGNKNDTSANQSNFSDLLCLLSNLDNALNEHLNIASVFKYTSPEIQNELLDCMYEVYLEDLKEDIDFADFVAVQVYETTDIICKNQFVVILRYIKECTAVERFVSFKDIIDYTTDGLSRALKEVLQPFNLENKLIAQRYDGSAVMSGAQVLLQESAFPYAKFVPYYAHQLDLVIKYACSKRIKSVKLFFANITGFTTFFSTSPKRSDVLYSVTNECILTLTAKQWNFQSQVIASVKENAVELMECFEKFVQENIWDDITVREAFGLKYLLKDNEFLFFLNFFYDLMKHIVEFYNAIQMQAADRLSILQALQDFETAVMEMRKNTDRYQINIDEEIDPLCNKRPKLNIGMNLVADAKEVCDILISQFKERFRQLHTFANFKIVDPKEFSSHRRKFPMEQINSFVTCYGPLISKEKLINELSVVYLNAAFKNVSSVSDLYRLFMEYSLEDPFFEVTKALRITLTTPIPIAESECNFNTLCRIKTFLRNTMAQERLNSLAFCSIHKEFLHQIPYFKDKVIERFASQEHRQAQLQYK